jgi:hypothetical protein
MDRDLVDLDRVEKIDKKEVDISSIPLSYLPIELSTGGRLGVPKIVYCRNFNTEDILTLSMLSTSIIPERMIAVLNSILYGKNDVSLWPDKSIIELLIQVYANYFTPILFQVKFPWDESDVEWLKEHKEEKKIDLLQKKLWIPRVDLDIRKAITIQKLDEEVKETITIKKKNREGKQILAVKFLSYPRYGDTLILKKYVQDNFKDTDKYDKVRLLAEQYSLYVDQGKDISTLPEMNLEEYLEWQNSELQREIALAKATQALYLLEYNGENLREKTLAEKIEYIGRPEFDIIVSEKLNSHYEKLKFGVLPQIKVKNPITGEVCVREYVFRSDDIVSAIQSAEYDGYDISYD